MISREVTHRHRVRVFRCPCKSRRSVTVGHLLVIQLFRSDLQSDSGRGLEPKARIAAQIIISARESSVLLVEDTVLPRSDVIRVYVHRFITQPRRTPAHLFRQQRAIFPGRDAVTDGRAGSVDTVQRRFCRTGLVEQTTNAADIGKLYSFGYPPLISFIFITFSLAGSIASPSTCSASTDEYVVSDSNPPLLPSFLPYDNRPSRLSPDSSRFPTVYIRSLPTLSFIKPPPTIAPTVQRSALC